MAGLVVVVAFALAFAVTTGFQDGASAVATTVATRAARPGTAMILAGLGCLVGPLLFGGAVARTVAALVVVPRSEVVAVVGAALSAAVLWNLVTWRLGLPSSASHARCESGQVAKIFRMSSRSVTVFLESDSSRRRSANAP